MLRSLAQRHEVYTLDLPGFGQSPAPDPERPFGIAALVDTVADWCAHAGVERPHIAGNSLGGAVALELGARGLASSVTALSPIGFTRGAEMLGSRILVGGMHVATRVPARVWHSVIDSRPVRALTTLALHGSVRDPAATWPGSILRWSPGVRPTPGSRPRWSGTASTAGRWCSVRPRWPGARTTGCCRSARSVG
ncbi:alpha/beta fold hydrolase [Nocardiopsis composta]